jgi:hypothetical protein
MAWVMACRPGFWRTRLRSTKDACQSSEPCGRVQERDLPLFGGGHSRRRRATIRPCPGLQRIFEAWRRRFCWPAAASRRRPTPDSYTQIGLRELSVQSAAQAAGSARALACCFRRPRRKLSASTVHGRTRMSSARAPKTTREGACAPQREPYPRSHSQVACSRHPLSKRCV